MTKTFKDIRESIAPAALARLKKHYKPLKNIDWSKHKDQVEKTTLVLKRLKMGTLIDLYKENIPLISDIAKSLVLKDKRFAHQVESVEEGGPPADGGPGSGAHNHKGSNKVFNKDRGIFKALLNLSKKKEYKKVSKAFVNLTMPSPMAKDKEIAKSLNKRLKQLAPKLGKKEKAKLLRIADLASTYESIEEGVNIKALAKQFRKNEDENRHSENYLMLAKAFGTSREVREVEAIIRRNKIQGHTDHKDIKWMFDNIGKYFHKLKESVEESLIVGFNKSSKEYKAGYAAAKKGIKYDDNPHDAGVHGMNWQSGHNAFKADQLRKAGKPNYGARGQFEEVQLDEVGPFQQVTNYLIKKGNNPKEVKRMVTKHMPYVAKQYPNASPAKAAEIISSLSATEEVQEADLSKTQIKMVHDKADELPKNDFIKRYGKDGDSVRYATATNIVKKKLGIGEEVELDEKFKVGDKVKANGYPGIIKVVHTDVRKGMVDVKLNRGTVTVSMKDVQKEEVTEERSPEVAGVLKKYIIGHPLRWSSREGKKNKKDFIKLQNLALTDMGKFRKKFDDMEADKGDDNYNQQAVRDVLAKAGLSKHLPK